MDRSKSNGIERFLDKREQVNVPGTHREYPNWRRGHFIQFDILRSQIATVGRAMAEEGRERPLLPAAD